jgi:long-chain acyl-CoA synthetase
MTNISDYLQKHKQDNPNKIFLKTEKDCLTYEETYNKVERVCSTLNQFPEKSVISIMFDNSIEFVLSYLAIIKSGRIVHIMSPSISKDNFLKQIESCDPIIILTLNKFKKEFDNIKNNIEFIDFEELEKQNIISKKNQISEIASLLYTSGTTSSPKGVQIKNSNIIFTTNNISNVLDYNNSDIDVIPLSLSHSFGLGCLHTSLYVGSTLILHKNSMNILDILNSIKENNATTFAAVPATLTSLVNNFPEKFAEKCNGLRLIITNSTKISKGTIQKILQLLPNTKLATYYGLTEASRSTFMIFNDSKNRDESVGKAAPGVEIKIVKDENKSKSGEIWIKGKNVIENYWNSEFSEKFDNGWLKTGDLGFLDDGFLYLTGRKDYVINVGGEKVNPEEIENIVKMMDSIDDAVAIGIEHQLFGQVIKLLIKTSNNVKIDSKSIITHCKKNLERYKIPTEIEFVRDFPRNEHGKIIRLMIKDSNHESS